MQSCSPERGPHEPLTSLIFPAYNPGALVERTWREVERFVRQAPRLWEVLFVCDGCTDGTPERLAGLTRGAGDHIRILTYTPNRGKGYAVRFGLQAARGAWRLFTDVDLAYGLEDVLRLARTLWAGAEVAVGSRMHPESQVVIPANLQGYAYRRYLQSLVFGFLARRLLPLTQKDTQAGLKGMTVRAATLLLNHLRCDGFGFDCELLTACARYGIPVVEVPVCVRFEDRYTTTGLRSMGQMIGQLWHIRQNWWKAPPISILPIDPGHRRAA